MRLSRRAIEDIIEWDVGNWSRALKLWEMEGGTDLKGCLALEIGGRNGGLSLWLALRGARTICSDLNGPSPRAVLLHRRYGVADLVEYRAIDVLDIPYGEGTFDVVAFKSVVGDLGEKEKQRKAFGEIYRVLKPGGRLFFAENLRGSPIHMFLRSRFVSWGRSWRYLSLDDLEEFLSIFSRRRCETHGFLAALGRDERQRRFLSLLDSLISPIVPPSWRYIAFGVAVK